MAEKRTIELEITDNSQSLKAQLKEAQAEVQKLADKYGATSKEAVEAAKKAAILKDKIGDAKALTDAFNPDAKFKALSGSLTGVAGGFSAVTGAMGLFGAESKEVEQVMLKVQSAMAIASGLQTLGESVDSMKQLGAVIKSNTVVQRILTIAQAAYNAVMAANPIGAIITAIVALIAAGYALIRMFQASAKANENAEKAIKENTKALEKQKEVADKSAESLSTKNRRTMEMAKASGQSAKALRELALKHAEEEIALKKATAATALNTYEREKNTLAMYKSQGVSDDLIKKQYELAKEARKQYEAATNEVTKAEENKKEVIHKNNVEIQQEKNAANEKLQQTNKEHNDKIKQQNEEAANAERDRIKQLKEDIAALDEEARVNKLSEQQKEIDSLNKKYDKIIEDGKKANIDVTKLEEEKRLQLEAINKKYDDLAQAKTIEAKKKAEELEKQRKIDFDAQIEALDEANFQARTKATMTAQNYELELVRQKYFAMEELAKGNADAEKTITEAKRLEIEAINKKYDDEEKKRRNEQINKYLDLAKGQFQSLGNLAQAFGESSKKNQKKAFNVKKAADIASATIDTYKSAQAAYSSMAGIPVVGPALGVVAAGMAVATGLLNIKKIASQKFEGGGSSGGGGGGGAGAGAGSIGGGASGGTQAPDFNVVGNNGLNQLAQLQQQPTQAFVVSGQVTSAQSLDRNRVQNATL
jgi:hypothetical protein